MVTIICCIITQLFLVLFVKFTIKKMVTMQSILCVDNGRIVETLHIIVLVTFKITCGHHVWIVLQRSSSTAASFNTPPGICAKMRGYLSGLKSDCDSTALLKIIKARAAHLAQFLTSHLQFRRCLSLKNALVLCSKEPSLAEQFSGIHHAVAI
eukprot:213746_1